MMDVFLFTLAAIALLVAIVALIRWKVRRDWARIERKMAERDHATLQSYKKHTIPGRRSSPDTTPSSSSRCSTQGDTAAPTPWDIPAMSAIHRSAEPSGLEPTIIGEERMPDEVRDQMKAMNRKAKWPNQEEVEALREKVKTLEAQLHDDHWPHGATVKLRWVGPGHCEKAGWAKRDKYGHLLSAYSLTPLDPSCWEVCEERPLETEGRD